MGSETAMNKPPKKSLNDRGLTDKMRAMISELHRYGTYEFIDSLLETDAQLFAELKARGFVSIEEIPGSWLKCEATLTPAGADWAAKHP
jgi:hypothetical protein